VQKVSALYTPRIAGGGMDLHLITTNVRLERWTGIIQEMQTFHEEQAVLLFVKSL
jgi:hypothetical protein